MVSGILSHFGIASIAPIKLELFQISHDVQFVLSLCSSYGVWYFKLLWYCIHCSNKIGISSNFTWCSVCAFSASSRYLLIFPFSFMVILGNQDIHKVPFPCVFLFDCYLLSVLSDLPSTSTSHSILTLPLAKVDSLSGICWYYPIFSLQSSQWTLLLTASWLTLYCLFAGPSQPLVICIADSSSAWHVLHFGDISCLSIVCLIQFVYKAWSWAVVMMASCPFFIHFILVVLMIFWLLLLWYFS